MKRLALGLLVGCALVSQVMLYRQRSVIAEMQTMIEMQNRVLKLQDTTIKQQTTALAEYKTLLGELGLCEDAHEQMPL